MPRPPSARSEIFPPKIHKRRKLPPPAKNQNGSTPPVSPSIPHPSPTNYIRDAVVIPPRHSTRPESPHHTKNHSPVSSNKDQSRLPDKDSSLPKPSRSPPFATSTRPRSTLPVPSANHFGKPSLFRKHPSNSALTH